jgi:hypothetical protein
MTKEFIIENQNKTLKELFPEHFTKFTGWAKTNTELSEAWLMYFKDNIIQYGFGGSGEWHINEKKQYQFDSEIDYEASSLEVESRLIEEAKRRGYSENNYKCLVSPEFTHVTDGVLFLHVITNCFVVGFEGSCNILMKHGVWAEVLNTMTKEEAEAKFNIVIR